MPTIKQQLKKVPASVVEENSPQLRGTSQDSSVDGKLRIAADNTSDPDGIIDPPVLVAGATLHAMKLTPRGYGYEITFLVPLDEEDKLGPLRRLSFQQLVDINVMAATAESWDD